MRRLNLFFAPVLLVCLLAGCSDSNSDSNTDESSAADSTPNLDAAFDPSKRTGENAGDELFDMFSRSSSNSEAKSDAGMSLKDELAIANANLDAAEANLKTKTPHATSREGIKHRMNAIKLNADREAAQGYLDILDD